MHGATYPAETSLDLKLNGMSWMDYVARHGNDVYLVDLCGYGRSVWLPEMDKPAGQNPPLTRISIAVKDVGAAVDFIRKRRNVSKINLLGWSWGASVMGMYTTQNNAKVNKLVLYVRAAMATQDGGAHRLGRQTRRLSHRVESRREGPLADGRSRGREGRTHSARLV